MEGSRVSGQILCNFGSNFWPCVESLIIFPRMAISSLKRLCQEERRYLTQGQTRAFAETARISPPVCSDFNPAPHQEFSFLLGLHLRRITKRNIADDRIAFNGFTLPMRMPE